jgi:hypothetical protein
LITWMSVPVSRLRTSMNPDEYSKRWEPRSAYVVALQSQET